MKLCGARSLSPLNPGPWHHRKATVPRHPQLASVRACSSSQTRDRGSLQPPARVPLLLPAELGQALCSCAGLLLLTAGAPAVPPAHAAVATNVPVAAFADATSAVPDSAPIGNGTASASASLSGSSISAPGCGPDGLCGGEVGGTLNTCGLAAPSCVSVMSDDGEHFVAPWEYELAGGREAAVEALIAVATGGAYEPVGLSSQPYVTNGYSRLDAAAYLIQSAASAVSGAPPPARPQPLRDPRGFVPFDGVLTDRHTTADGGIYLRIVFGSGQQQQQQQQQGGPGAAEGALAAAGGGGGGGGGGGAGQQQQQLLQVLEAEFLFPRDDSIVTLRCAERAAAGAALGTEEGGGGVGGMMAALGVGGGSGDLEEVPAGPSGSGSGSSGSGGRLMLSFDSGLTWDTNTARRQMEALRKALRWQVVPVVAEFDPKFNNDKPLWFERLYAPFRAVGAGVGGAGARGGGSGGDGGGAGGGGAGDPLLD
ncbi:hypothetical protein HYH02_015087 [Chlamydomonas schloesseri]|uniref:Uncharacterized protein n=1 Tax=Chlamydomonas schloesseri TaxID=2026947 RepID=A0A835VTS5_9CHLO|nr:hypothetical protein HYH02_015087 [Chlamydomonas schloesseri]|eukprot:KAG2425036.1 hypothetical protein HYH02_015087 [Chlamydomonas schloesseri]